MNVTLFAVWLNIVGFKCLEVLFYNTHPFPWEWVSGDFHSVKPGVWFFILDSLILRDHKNLMQKNVFISSKSWGKPANKKKHVPSSAAFQESTPHIWPLVPDIMWSSFIQILSPWLLGFLVCVSQNSMNIITNWWSFKNNFLFNALLGSQLFHFSSFYLLISAG